MENFTLTLTTGTAAFDGTTVTLTDASGNVTSFVNSATVSAPTVTPTDAGITVTHADGTTQDFVPAS